MNSQILRTEAIKQNATVLLCSEHIFEPFHIGDSLVYYDLVLFIVGREKQKK